LEGFQGSNGYLHLHKHLGARNLQVQVYLPAGTVTPISGGIERISANENLGKFLKVSHFYLGFSLNENHDEIKHSHSIFIRIFGLL